MKRSSGFAFVIPTLKTGGAELQTINQLNFLWEVGFRNCYCVVLTNENSNFGKLKISDENIKIFEWNDGLSTLNGSSLGKSFRLARELAKFVKQKNITTVISILPYAHFCCRLARFILFYRKICLATYYRGDYFSTSPLNTLPKKLFNKLNSLFAFLFDTKTLFISKVVLDDISRNFFVRNSLVLPNSLPAKPVSTKPALKFIEDRRIKIENKFVIVFPGRFHRQKGHAFFIECIHEFIKRYEQKGRKILVILAGEGPEESAIVQQINEFCLSDRFEKVGVIDNHVLLSLFSLVNLVVIPSINEGFGNVCIEGLLQKSIMLVSDVGGLSEIIIEGVNGFKFQSLNKEEFIAKLKLIYCNDKNILDPEVIFKSFLDNYTIEKQVANILRHCNIKTDNQIEF